MSCSESPLPEIPDKPVPEVEEEEVVEPPIVDIDESKLPKLNVVGRYLKNEAGEIVNLHGFAQTYRPFFNQNAWNNYNVAGCLSYNKRMINEIMSAGWKMNFVRMHMDPYWSNTLNVEPLRYEGHETFSQTRFKKYLDEVFVPMAEHAISKGLYVVFRPPGVSPERIAVDDDYNKFLELVWDIVSKHPKIKNNSDIMFELANEPINIKGPNGDYASSGQGHFDEMKKFCQNIVDKIRANSNNIIWVPGLAYQSSFSGFANNPIEGTNIGYAVHAYPGWYGSDTEEASPELGGEMGGGYESFQRGWDAQVKPVSDFAPILVTEMDWAPKKYNSSWGKSFTGEVGGPGFGANFKYIADITGNVSWLIFTECHHLAAFRNVEGTPGEYTFLNDPEACPWPTFHWYNEYATGVNGIESNLEKISVKGIDNQVQILTGDARNLIVQAHFSDGSTRYVTSDSEFDISDNFIITIDKSGRMSSLKDGEAVVTVSYSLSEGNGYEFTFNVKSTTFPLTNEMFNPSIWESGSFDEDTKTLITGQYGFGGWQYGNGVDLSSYKYLVVELGSDNDSSVSFRLFDENNYWSGAAIYDFNNQSRIEIDLHSMVKGDNKVKVDPSHIYIMGFWSLGSKPIIIKNIYLTNTL